MGTTRRSALRLASASLCIGVGGCSSVQPSSTQSEGARLTEITLLNRETESHLIDVMVRDDDTDEAVFWNRFDAPAATTAGESSNLDSVGRTTWKDPVLEPGNYSVYTDADIGTDATDTNWTTSDVPESGCIGIDVIVSRDGQLRLQTYSQSCE